MRSFQRLTSLVLGLVLVLALGACGDDTDAAADRAEDAAAQAARAAKQKAGEAREAAGDAFATFRTGAERLVDEASSGDNEALEKLLDQCRDTLEQMRKDNDPRAERVGALCEKIRNADDGNAWKEIREEFKQIGDDDN